MGALAAVGFLSVTFILNLHGIGKPRPELPDSEKAVWIDENTFQALLDFVKDRPEITMTFDDSNESDFKIAFPALQERGMKAQFFAVADRLDRSGYLSRQQLESMTAAGMQIGSHGMKHRPWAGLDSAALHEELVEARDRIEQVTRMKIDQAACPFGSYNQRVLRSLRDAGYARAYTSDGGPANGDTFLIPRNSVQRTDTPESIRALVSRRAAMPERMWRRLKLGLKQWR